MSSQVLEITNPGYTLKLQNGFVNVFEGKELLGKVVLDDLLCVLISVPGCLISTNLMDKLANLNIPISICGEGYLPTSFSLPVVGIGRQFQTMRAQALVTEPMRKRCWQAIVKSKLTNQADLLEQLGVDAKRIRILVNKVRSGDPDNCEAQGARVYWQKLFGSEFRRDQSALNRNVALNYSYTVLRSCMARAVIASGLHPSFSLHHRNPQNPINLVDDLMEPFRPICDSLVNIHFDSDFNGELTIENKKKLAITPTVPIVIGNETSPLSIACVRLARSFSNILLNEKQKLELPALPSQIQMRAI